MGYVLDYIFAFGVAVLLLLANLLHGSLWSEQILKVGFVLKPCPEVHAVFRLCATIVPRIVIYTVMGSYGILVVNDGVAGDSSSGNSSFSLDLSCVSPPVFIGSTDPRSVRYSSVGELTEKKDASETNLSFRLAHPRVVPGSLSGSVFLNRIPIQNFNVDPSGSFNFSDVGSPQRKAVAGFLNLASGSVEMIYGSVSSSSSSSSAFLETYLVVDYMYEETIASFRMTNVFSKRLDRIASSKNPIKSAKSAISEYAGCYEAAMVRKRAIALSRIRLSISGEQFRFRLP